MAKAAEIEVKIADMPEFQQKVADEIAALKSQFVAKLAEYGVEADLETKADLQVNWNELVTDDDKIKIDGEDYITLAGLRRLARIRGYLSSMPKVVQVPEYENHRNATVEWNIVWHDGTVDGAAADASWRTVNKGFRNFPVAIASNRAEARCIRSALGIETCSYEEIGPADEDLSGPINDQQINLIKMLFTRFDIETGEDIHAIGSTVVQERHLENGKFMVDRLSYEEAGKLIAELNKHGAKFKKGKK